MQFYTVYFDTNTMKLNADVITLSDSHIDEGVNKILDASGYDYYDYSDDIVILVDDQGLFKEGLPVFEVESTYGDTARLAGKLIFVRNVETEFSTDIGSIRDEDIVRLRDELQIQFIGFTKGVR